MAAGGDRWSRGVMLLALGLLGAPSPATARPRLHVTHPSLGVPTRLTAHWEDGAGHPVLGARPEDFQLLFDGATYPVAQQLADDPEYSLYLVVVVQTSAVDGARLDAERRGVRSLAAAVESLLDGRIGLVTSSGAAHQVVELGPAARLPPALSRLTTDEGPADRHLYEAVQQAIDLLSGHDVPWQAQKFVVVLSDGENDRGPVVSIDPLVRRAARNDVVIDTVTFATDVDRPLPVEELARRTDGRQLRARSPDEIAARLDDIATGVAHPYHLAFDLQYADGEHRLQLIVGHGADRLRSAPDHFACDDCSTFPVEPEPFWRTRRFRRPALIALYSIIPLTLLILIVAGGFRRGRRAAL